MILSILKHSVTLIIPEKQDQDFNESQQAFSRT